MPWLCIELQFRVDPFGDLVVLGSGIIHNGTTLERLPVALSNAFDDAAFAGSGIRTVRNMPDSVVQLQDWTLHSLEAQYTIELSGHHAHRLLTLNESTTLAVTTDSRGVPAFHIIGEDFALVQ